MYHDDVINWKHFPRYWPFVRGIHRSLIHWSLVDSLHKGQWRRALIFSLICAWTNVLANRDAGYLRRHRAQYDVIRNKHSSQPENGTIYLPQCSTLFYQHLWETLYQHLMLLFTYYVLIKVFRNRVMLKRYSLYLQSLKIVVMTPSLHISYKRNIHVPVKTTCGPYHGNTYIYINIYIHIHIYVCVCVCISVSMFTCSRDLSTLLGPIQNGCHHTDIFFVDFLVW